MLSISVRPAPNPPSIVTSLPSPLLMIEDTTFSFSTSTLSLAYVDGLPDAVLHAKLTVSAEAASYGVRLRLTNGTDAAPCALTMTLAEVNVTTPVRFRTLALLCVTIIL